MARRERKSIRRLPYPSEALVRQRWHARQVTECPSPAALAALAALTALAALAALAVLPALLAARYGPCGDITN